MLVLVITYVVSCYRKKVYLSKVYLSNVKVSEYIYSKYKVYYRVSCHILLHFNPQRTCTGGLQ